MGFLKTAGSLQQPLLGIAEHAFSRYKPSPKPETPAEGFDVIPPTSKHEMDKILQKLDNQASDWAAKSPLQRAKLLRHCIDTTLEIAEEAASIAAKTKGSYGSGIGEELLTFVPIISAIREYAESLEAGGTPRTRLSRHSTTGQWIADVFPSGLDALLFGGFEGQLWIKPGQEPTQGALYRSNGPRVTGVGLVLGAGNQTPVAPLDILHVLLVENLVVVCKMNPVNEYLGPYLRRAFSPLVDAGFLEFAYGGGKEGSYLCNHTMVKSVHLTGSQATYDAIVWGDGTITTKDKAGKTPPYTKPVAAELGCVTPYIIVPGQWTDADIDYHAETVATGLTQNAGHNCLKAEILVTDRNWPQREAFLNAIRKKLFETPNRVAYYPGSGHRAAAFKEKFPDAEQLGAVTCTVDADGALIASSQDGTHVDIRRLPWLLKTGLAPENAATQDENWCGVLQEVSLHAATACKCDPEAFLSAAVDFANTKCWGTLSCVIIAHPVSQKKYRKAFQQAIVDLKYGTVCINVPGTIGFSITTLAWGGYPGTTPQDIGSGNCKVHNTLFFDHVEKSVLYGPWRFHPFPFWFTSHKNQEETARLSLKFMAKPSLRRILPLVPAAILG